MLVPMRSSGDFLGGRSAAILSAVRSGSNRLPPSLRGAKRRSNPALRLWIASRSLSSGAHSRDPLARNDVESIQQKSPGSGFSEFSYRHKASVRLGPDLL